MLLSASLEVLGDFLEVKPNITDNVFYWKHNHHHHHQLFARWQWWDWQLGGRSNKWTGGAGELILGNIIFFSSWYITSTYHPDGIYVSMMVNTIFTFYSFFLSPMFILFGHQAIQQWISNGGIENLIMQVLYLSPGIIFVLYEIYICQLQPLNNQSINQSCSSSAEEVW